MNDKDKLFLKDDICLAIQSDDDLSRDLYIHGQPEIIVSRLLFTRESKRYGWWLRMNMDVPTEIR